MPFPRREEYERLLYSLSEIYPGIQASTLRLYSNSPTTCFVRGSLLFHNALELRVFEYLDLADGELLSYSYTIFQGEERIRWYDPQPHPESSELATTFPHHFHEPPDIKHNRKPAPDMSFTALNLPALISECINLMTETDSQEG
jgi:hypothetical protein